VSLADCYSEKYLRQGGRQPREDCSSFGLSIGALDAALRRGALSEEMEANVNKNLTAAGLKRVEDVKDPGSKKAAFLLPLVPPRVQACFPVSAQ
jgi:hypothetical protein